MNIYKEVYELQPNVSLAPGKSVIINKNDGPIVALHCIKQPEKNIVFRLWSSRVITLPPDAFVPGAIYPYKILQINEEGAKCFMGLATETSHNNSIPAKPPVTHTTPQNK